MGLREGAMSRRHPCMSRGRVSKRRATQRLLSVPPSERLSDAVALEDRLLDRPSYEWMSGDGQMKLPWYEDVGPRAGHLGPLEPPASPLVEVGNGHARRRLDV